MKTKFTFLFSLLLCASAAFAQTKPATKAIAQKAFVNKVEYKKVTIYTTAENSDFRITRTGEKGFTAYAQPVEGELSIFVDPSKTHQSVLGIGAAFTDASAETFAKKLLWASQDDLY